MKKLIVFTTLLFAILLTSCSDAPDDSSSTASSSSQKQAQPKQDIADDSPKTPPLPSQQETQPKQAVKTPLSVEIDISQLPKTSKTFKTGKERLWKIYKGRHEKTFYCNCQFNPDTLEVDLQSCGVTPRKNAKRAKRVEAEHVVPAHRFGSFRRCWREPKQVCPQKEGKKITGRECCKKVDPVFLTAHNDLHNLYPAVGEVNGDRSNFSWGMIPGERRNYGQCNIEVDTEIRRAEPPEDVMGNVARAEFYASEVYGLILSEQEIKLFTAWHKSDPVDAWEMQRNELIAEIQGNRNPFIDGAVYDPNKIAKFPDFSNADFIAIEQPEPEPQPIIDWSAFDCEPKKNTCNQMESCEESIYHLLECGNANLDGDGDGVPCKSLCGDRKPMPCDPNKTRCGDMESCDMAQFYLNVCRVSRLDGDGDGKPCAALCK